MSSRLSLNLGMRWEYYSPTYSDDQGREANFDFATGNMVLASLGDINKYAGVNPRFNNFAPRFGLAYTLSAKTVLRAGYGRSYAINSGGANFGTYCCQWPIGNNQSINSTTNYTRIFRFRKVRLLSRTWHSEQRCSARSSGPDGLRPAV